MITMTAHWSSRQRSAWRKDDVRYIGCGRRNDKTRRKARLEPGRYRAVLEKVQTTVKIDFGELRYISSAGLGLLLGTQKRLIDSGHKLEIINMTPHIRDIFTIAGFDFIFDIK